jgi:hypothetical protein
LFIGLLLLQHQCPNTLKRQLGFQLVRELVVILQDRVQEIPGILRSNREKALAPADPLAVAMKGAGRFGIFFAVVGHS